MVGELMTNLKGVEAKRELRDLLSNKTNFLPCSRLGGISSDINSQLPVKYKISNGQERLQVVGQPK